MDRIRRSMMLLRRIGLAVFVLLTIGVLAIHFGVYNVAADRPHWPITERVLEWARERAIAVRLQAIKVPDLDDEQRVQTGALHYEAMCAQCHLRPGEHFNELNLGLYPRPPDLARPLGMEPADPRWAPEPRNRSNAARHFWIIKHGLKFTSMPAWGETHDDESLWALVAFLRKLPGLSPARYAEITATGSEQGGEQKRGHRHHDHSH